MRPQRSRLRRCECGESSLSSLLWLGGIAAIIYFGLMYVPVYVELYEVKQVLRQAGNRAYTEHNDETIRRFISEKLKEIGSHYEIRDGQEYNLPGIVVLDHDIFVNRDEGKSIVLQVKYRKVINYPFTSRQKTLDFSPSHKADLAPVKW